MLFFTVNEILKISLAEALSRREKLLFVGTPDKQKGPVEKKEKKRITLIGSEAAILKAVIVRLWRSTIDCFRLSASLDGRKNLSSSVRSLPRWWKF